jgi:hypothetical protein
MIPASELEAVNAMLSAVGEAPVASLTGTLPTNVTLARNLLTRTSREVQGKGWRFNTEFGYEIAPAGTVDWEDTSGVTTELNVFKAPTGLATFTVTKHPWQQGLMYVDTEIRPSRLYVEGTPEAPVMIFYDRASNRDGWSVRPFLYIDPVWLFDWDALPSSARDYITIKAIRRFQQTVAGAPDLAGLTILDERDALAALQRDQGMRDDYNIFKNGSVSRIMGRRPHGAAGVIDFRISPNKV